MKNQTVSRVSLARRGAARPAAIAASAVLMVGFALIAPAAWTEIQHPGTGAPAARPDCRARAEAETVSEPLEVTDEAKFMQWAVAAHRSAASPASFTALAAARALSLDERN